MGAPVLGPLFGWIVYLIFDSKNSKRSMLRSIESSLDWFPNFVSQGLANLLINDVMTVVYIIIAGLIGLSIDSALSR